MDLRQLAALVAVADHGGFSAAADALHTVQSNVSSHVARLERELGVTLVDRHGGKLTEEGALVVARARRISGELEGAVSDLAALRHEIVGPARLGMIGTTARWLVPRVLAMVSERHPGVHLVVVDATSTSLEPRLLAGELDLAVVNLPVPGRDLTCESLFDEDLLLVVPAGHPLAGRAGLEMAELADVELILPPPGTAFRGELDAAAVTAGVVLRPMAEVDGLRLIAGMAMEGRGPAIVPATGVSGPSDPDLWRALPVRGLPRRRVGVAQRRRSLPAAPTTAVLEVLRQVVGAAELQGLHPPTPQPR
ncbi:MAG TPA: LysR family transcriptional regulator [Acidimicrobiales bacterium]|jgi:LysR family hydrogen peroxide-inducible transcriptional activator